MMFASLLSLLFYEKVAYMYFLPGHTHMHPDRVVGWCKQAIRGLNLYTLSQITDECQNVASVTAEHLQATDADFPFRIGWFEKLEKYFKKLPAGYTNSFFFEFTQGYCTFRRLASTPDSEAYTVHVFEYTEALKKKVMVDFFNCVEARQPKMIDLTLPKHPGRILATSKLKSLAKKYFTIPVKYRSFYPKELPKQVKKLSRKSKSKSKKRKRESSETSKKKVKRKVGRPKLLAPIPTGVQSISKFFRAL